MRTKQDADPGVLALALTSGCPCELYEVLRKHPFRYYIRIIC